MTPPLTPAGSPAAPRPSFGAPGFPELYERLLVAPLFTPWAERLLDLVPVAAGARVLDVACGTGIVARLARRRVGDAATIVGVDRSAAMLDVARAIEPGIEWREGDAAAPPLAPDERFDAVLCHQGLQFFADRPAAVGAMRDALAPDGRVAIAVWRSRRENGAFDDLDRVAERFVGRVEDVRHSFGDEGALARLLEGAGFGDVRVAPASLETRFALAPDVLARLNASALVGMSDAGKAASEGERAALVDAIVAASVPALARYADAGAIAFTTSANLATAARW